jgi:hypothetical protein
VLSGSENALDASRGRMPYEWLGPRTLECWHQSKRWHLLFLDDIAEMDADPEVDATLGRQTGITLDHAVLHLDRAAHCVDHAAELDNTPVASALYYAPVMYGDGRIDQIATERAQPRKRTLLVGTVSLRGLLRIACRA